MGKYFDRKEGLVNLAEFIWQIFTITAKIYSQDRMFWESSTKCQTNSRSESKNYMQTRFYFYYCLNWSFRTSDWMFKS